MCECVCCVCVRVCVCACVCVITIIHLLLIGCTIGNKRIFCHFQTLQCSSEFCVVLVCPRYRIINHSLYKLFYQSPPSLTAVLPGQSPWPLLPLRLLSVSKRNCCGGLCHQVHPLHCGSHRVHSIWSADEVFCKRASKLQWCLVDSFAADESCLFYIVCYSTVS